MTREIMLSEAELAIVRGVLRSHLPPGVRAWVFGSRATGSARRYSDLDIALEGDIRLAPTLAGDVAEALAESDLPYKSDVIDLLAVEPAFRSLIEPDLIALPY